MLLVRRIGLIYSDVVKMLFQAEVAVERIRKLGIYGLINTLLPSLIQISNFHNSKVIELIRL